MSTLISLFDYYLPPEQIAQAPVEPRDLSRLLVLKPFNSPKQARLAQGLRLLDWPRSLRGGEIEHRRFFEIIDYLRPGDVLVMNDTKVFKARLRGKVKELEVEVFLLCSSNKVWQALLRPGRKIKINDEIDFGELKAKVINKAEDGTARLGFSVSPEDVLSFTDCYGEIPVPPYIKQVPDKLETYQTIYARETGSVAAPTAGFHFTKELLKKIKRKGIEIEFVTLHIGLGTFRPVKSETLEEHKMHSELVEIKSEVARRINAAKKTGRRIIAVGTTTTRALEGVASTNNGVLPENGFFGEVNIFITPGFKFNIIDSLITNFHLPKSTLLVLVSALAGRENILRAYKEAIREGYRFYSFGDAMFIC